jgi:hypothetical protein
MDGSVDGLALLRDAYDYNLPSLDSLEHIISMRNRRVNNRIRPGLCDAHFW